MPFVPHSAETINAMLAGMGESSIEQLFDEIPSSLRINGFDLPDGKSQWEVKECMAELAAKDKLTLNFAGAGAYEHTIPSAVWSIASRGEFLTAYTPYQAEASQGTLQVIYEYQTMMSRLMATDIINASMYDGATTVAEAALMACRIQRKIKSHTILVPKNLHPHYREVMHSYLSRQNIALEEIPFDPATGLMDSDAFKKLLSQKTITAVVINQPNFFGLLEDTHALTKLAKEHEALVIACVNPLAMSVLEAPGHWSGVGADIVCGDGQVLGLPLSAGGPYFGFMGCKKEFVRQLPGRLVAKTHDENQKTGFTLTLQAREQHIRRGKATSNICTNQGLLVTAATIYMSLMGREGLQRVANMSHHQAVLLQEKLKDIGVHPKFTSPFFLEQVYDLPIDAEKAINALIQQEKILAGIALKPWYPECSNSLLIACTENKSEHKLKRFVDALGAVLMSLAGENA